MQWALASGVERDDLLYGTVPLETHALSHWCWHTCERDTLAAAMAATNYAIEGVTGDWSALVCSEDTYENGFPSESRAKAMSGSSCTRSTTTRTPGRRWRSSARSWATT